MIWQKRVYKAEVASMKKIINIYISPVNIGFTEFKLERGGARIAFQADMIARTDKPGSNTQELPKAKKVPASSDRLAFGFPLLTLPYADIQGVMRDKLVNTLLQSRTMYGTYDFSIHDLRLYSHGKDLALALYIEASNTEEWFATKGWVYMTLQPKIAATGETLVLRLKGFSDEIDPGLSLALSNTVSEKLKHLVLNNMKKELRLLRLAIKPVLINEKHGAALNLGTASIRIGNISLEKDQLRTEAIFIAPAKIIDSNLAGLEAD